MTKGEQKISLAEWCVAGVSGALVLFVLTTLLMHASREQTPPALKVTVDAVSPEPHGFVVRFTVANDGGSTAEDVRVEGTLGSGTDQETSDTTIDFVPDGSRVRGGLLFTKDPRGAELTVRPLGYRDP